MDILAMGARIEVRLERILGDPPLEAGAGPRRALEQGGLVVPRPCVASAAGNPNIPRQHERQVRRAVHLGRVEPVVDPFPWWIATGKKLAMSFARRTICSFGVCVIWWTVSRS